MEAAPIVTARSLAICGNSESVTRTMAWLAKAERDNRKIARLGAAMVAGRDTLNRLALAVRAIVDSTHAGGLSTALAPGAKTGIPDPHDRQDLPAFRR